MKCKARHNSDTTTIIIIIIIIITYTHTYNTYIQHIHTTHTLINQHGYTIQFNERKLETHVTIKSRKGNPKWYIK